MCFKNKSFDIYFFFCSPTLYIGQYPHGLYALPSLVDELTTTYATAQSGPLLLEGPANTNTNSEASSPVESPVSVNLRLPSDLKLEWIDQYHSNLGSSPGKPPIILFGKLGSFVCVSYFFTFQFLSFINCYQTCSTGHYRVPETPPGRKPPILQVVDEVETPRVPIPMPQEELVPEDSKWPYVAFTAVTAVLLSGVTFFFCGRKSYQKASSVGQYSNSSTASVKRDPAHYSTAIELESGFIQVFLKIELFTGPFYSNLGAIVKNLLFYSS